MVEIDKQPTHLRETGRLPCLMQ